MSEHTPGPWVITIGTGTLNESIRGPNDEGIAQTGCWHREHRPEAIANAQLIASAPDLLEALEAVVNDNHPATRMRPSLIHKAHAAIEKAKGERQ